MNTELYLNFRRIFGWKKVSTSSRKYKKLIKTNVKTRTHNHDDADADDDYIFVKYHKLCN